MKRCCLCRAQTALEVTDLPGSGYRCRDHVNCRRRVRAIRASADWPEDEIKPRIDSFIDPRQR